MNKYKFDEQGHQHSLDGKPLTGTSSVVGVLNKPLSWWAAGEAVKTLGWVHPDIKVKGKKVGEVSLEERIDACRPMYEAIKDEPIEMYLSRLDMAYRAHSATLTKSAKAGTDLHYELEQYVKSQINGTEYSYDPVIEPFVKWSEQSVKEYLWSEAYCYDEDLWVGGISDAGAILNELTIETPDGQVIIPDGTIAVIDFKSSKEAYTSHFIQAAGYAIQILKNGLLDSEGNLVKRITGPIEALITVPFGADIVYPEIRMQADKYKKGFESALYLYRLLGLDKSGSTLK